MTQIGGDPGPNLPVTIHGVTENYIAETTNFPKTCWFKNNGEWNFDSRTGTFYKPSAMTISTLGLNMVLVAFSQDTAITD